MAYIKIIGSRFHRLFFILLSLSLLIPLVHSTKANAKILEQQSIVVGSGLPSVSTSNNFSFIIKSLDDVGSIAFEYCKNSSIYEDTCDVPTDVDVTGANLVFQAGNEGFIISGADSTANKLVIKRAPAAAAAVIASKYNFTNIVNPSTGGTVFVRISTYASTDGSGAYIDNGAVAFAVNAAFVIGAYVPPFLRSCAGVTVSADCSGSSGTIVDLGTLAPSGVGTGTSQFAMATNSPTGVALYMLGTTMTSGNNLIDPLADTSFSAPGNKQFGINLRSNTLPAVGSDPSGPGGSVPTSDYNLVNRFRFNSGEMIARSTQATDYKTFTVSYIANISRNTPVGIYSTSLTYLAVAEF